MKHINLFEKWQKHLLKLPITKKFQLYIDVKTMYMRFIKKKQKKTSSKDSDNKLLSELLNKLRLFKAKSDDVDVNGFTNIKLNVRKLEVNFNLKINNDGTFCKDFQFIFKRKYIASKSFMPTTVNPLKVKNKNILLDTRGNTYKIKNNRDLINFIVELNKI